MISDEELVQRGLEAGAVLNSHLFQEAFQTLRDRLLNQWEVSSENAEEREALYQQIHALNKVEGFLTQTMQFGTAVKVNMTAANEQAHAGGDALRA